jgi:hypothetical protein
VIEHPVCEPFQEEMAFPVSACSGGRQEAREQCKGPFDAGPSTTNDSVITAAYPELFHNVILSRCDRVTL